MRTTSAQSDRSYTPVIVFILSVLALGFAERALAAADGAAPTPAATRFIAAR